jgi:hypothetical protein
MMRLREFSLKKAFFTVLFSVLFCSLTWQSKAIGIKGDGIYSTLTTDTVPVRNRVVADTTRDSSRLDTLPRVIQRTDTFSFKASKDTLDAPVNYEAEDSAVVLAREKKIILYGKTKTTYKDVTLTAPKVELDQQTGIVTAYNDRDSLGQVLTRARFSQAENQFESDTIVFNFKTQKGLTRNTFTKQDEMYVHGETIKKVNANTIFVSRGQFTTCNFDEPHFAFRANKMKVVNSKVAVTGPVHPEFEGVPVPVYLPFGYYPLSRGRHSGLLPPQFTNNEQFGLGLEGLGYYKVINDNVDVTLRGNIYSYGGWSAGLTPTYRRRYKYNGALNLNLQHTKFNFKGDPDYQKTKTFFINWSHVVDQKARPGTSFSANVNAGSTKFNELIPNNARQNFNNQLSSSIAYSKTWQGKPYNLTMSANHNQNSFTRLINLTIPDAGFTVNTIFPLQRKEAVGSKKWYEQIGIGYNGSFRNQAAFYDTAFSSRRFLDTIQAGASHRIPITLSLPPAGPLIISPFVSYEEQWMMQKTYLDWNGGMKKVDTTTEKGFYTDRKMSFGISMNTNIYGTVQFKRSKLVALRHVVRPTFGLSYSPSFSGKHFKEVQVDTNGRTIEYSTLSNNIFSGYGNNTFGGISFGVDNNLESKWRSKKDTINGGIKKVRLIDGFGFNSNYNFLLDSMQLGDFQLYLRSTLFDKINLTASANLTPYQENEFGQRISRYYWQDGLFRPGRFTQGSISLSTQFRSKPKDPSKQPNINPTSRQISDPTLLGDQQRLMDYMRRNPAEFVDFNIPWDIGIDFSGNFHSRQKSDFSGYETEFDANMNIRSSFSLTPKWNFSTNGSFNFDEKKVTMLTMSINRDMHCWQMSIGVTPVGQFTYFNITISPKSSILQDLKVNRTRTFYNF